MMGLAALALPLLVLGVALLALALGTVVLAPVLATRVAAGASKPRLERRASGPDRMRTLITAQRTVRSRSQGLAVALKRGGIVLGVLSVLSLTGGLVALAMGPG